MTHKNCFYCNEKSNLYLKSSNKNLNENYNFTSTEADTSENEIKPDLYFCKDCEIIFSEFIDTKFEDNYRDVLDDLYISQINNNRILTKNSTKVSKPIKNGTVNEMTADEIMRMRVIERYRLMRLGKYKISKKRLRRKKNVRKIQVQYKFTEAEISEIDQNLGYYCIAKDDYYKSKHVLHDHF